MGVVNWLNSNAGAVQTVLAAILVIVTAAYAWLTRRIAVETAVAARSAREGLDLSRRGLGLSRRQSLDATLPVVAIRLAGTHPGGDTRVRRFTVDARNVGPGPAIDVVLVLRHEEPSRFVLGPGEEAHFSVTLDGSQVRRLAYKATQPGTLALSYKDIHGRAVGTELTFRITYLAEEDAYIIVPGSTVFTRPDAVQSSDRG